MSAPLQVAIAAGSVLVLLSAMALVKRLGAAWSWPVEVQRKLVHIGTGLYALSLPWLFADDWPVYMLVALMLAAMAVLRLPSVATTGIGSTIHGVERQSHGDIFFAISVGLAFFLSFGVTVLYVLPMAVLTLADAAAALTGSAYGKRFFQIEAGRKSIEGSAIFFLITLTTSMICLLLLSDVPRLNVIVLSIMVAAFGTLVEVDSWRGYDNFFLPLGLLIFLAGNLAKPVSELFLLACLFIAALAVAIKLGRHLGFTAHTIRVYSIAGFLLLSVTAVHNTILPMLVLATHAWARRAAPGTARFPDLDVVAGVAVVSFGWLALGNATGWNAVTFYGMTAMGMGMGMIALASGGIRRPARYAVLIASAAGLGAAFLWLAGLNDTSALWSGTPWPLALATLAVTAILPSVLRDGFQTARVTRVVLLALLVPLPAYLFLVLQQQVRL
jgi:phytol kinase